MGKHDGMGIRIERKLKALVHGIDVGERYPLPYDDPGFLEAVKASAAADCARAIGNGSLDESAVRVFAHNVVGSSQAKTNASFEQRAAGNEEILHAMEAAEAKQVAYLKAVKSRYEDFAR
ncbi:MAG: hypothetical protein IJH04_03335 [Eggerthellaceae bacterium]|nr:hypothetical protein [Eggerthellaceae bacterium]